MTKTIEQVATANSAARNPADQHEESARRWFPLRADMMQNRDFLNLTICEKLVMLDINYRLAEHLSLVKCDWKTRSFGEADTKWAKRLDMSVEAFRRARRKLGKLGWVVFRSGYRTHDGKRWRTEYHDAKYAETGRGIQSGAVYRCVWHGLLAGLKKNQLHHRDPVVAAYVAYFWKILGGREMGSVTIPKAKVASVAGMPAATFKASLERLRSVKLRDKDGSTQLFKFRDRHRYGIELTEWAGGPDAGISRPTSTHESVPLIAILNRSTETIEGDRGSKSLQVSGVDRVPNRTRMAAKLEGGRGPDV